jgi:MarR family transcriptional regulator for hemolysin
MDAFDHELMQLTMSLTAISRAYKAVADQVASGFGLSQATAWPVVMIARLGGGDQLIASGLVERRDDASDRRARTLHLTAEGEARASQLEEALVPFRRTLFSDIARQDIAACARVLGELSGAIAAYTEATGSRQPS